MSTVSPPNSRSTSVRAYRALLVAYPKHFREHYETQMVQVFRDSFRDAYVRGGTSGAIDLWIHTCADLLVSALIERVAEGSHNMFSPKLIFVAGLASVCGGLLWCTLLFSVEGGAATLPAALVLTFVGLAALHARQGRQVGALSRIGFGLGIVGTAMVLWFFVWGMLPGHTLDAARNPDSFRQFVAFALGMSLLGIGYILIGLQMLLSKVQRRTTSILPVALGALHVGFGICIWLVYSMTSNGINAWKPMSVPVSGIMLLSFGIGILWVALGTIIAVGSAQLETSTHPPAPA